MCVYHGFVAHVFCSQKFHTILYQLSHVTVGFVSSVSFTSTQSLHQILVSLYTCVQFDIFTICEFIFVAVRQWFIAGIEYICVWYV